MSAANPEAAASPGGVDLEAFESLVYSRRYEDAVRELLSLIRLFKQNLEFPADAYVGKSREELYSRLAAAIGALLCDPLFTLSQEGFDLLAVEHATLSAIFRASVFGSADHLLRQFGTPNPNDPGKMELTSSEGIGRLLVLYSLDSGFELDFEQTIRIDPRRALPALLGMLAGTIVISPMQHKRRERLLGLGRLLEGAELRERMVHAMVSSYMCASYAESRTKHEIKRSFNRMMRSLLETYVPVPSFPEVRELKAHPTMLVPLEAFGSRHAMYRCNALAMRRLRERFRLVAICGMDALDDISRQLFDDVMMFDEGVANMHDFVGSIRSLNPDVVFYPSLGMSTNWVAMSSIRLAPIQFMALGHPATSMSETIDYVLTSETLPGHPSTLQEIAFLVSGSQTMVSRYDADFPEPVIREKPDVLRIAVPSMVAKLNAPFLGVCRNLARQSRRKLEFHFFPNLSGLWHHVTTLEIRRWLPDAIVYPTDDYNRYLRNLAGCDIHLSTFPFGGTNTNMDTMKLCIPMVTLEGLEVHSQMDSAMMRAVGMPEWLIARDVVDYESAALRLINDDSVRVEIARMLNHLEIEKIFSDRPGNDYSTDFADAIWFAYANHEAIQRVSRRYWTVAQRRAFSAYESS